MTRSTSALVSLQVSSFHTNALAWRWTPVSRKVLTVSRWNLMRQFSSGKGMGVQVGSVLMLHTWWKWWSDAALGSEMKSCCLQAHLSHKQQIGKTIIDPQVWHQGWFQPWEINICQTTIATILPKTNRFHHITYPWQWWSVIKWCCIRVWHEVLLPSSTPFIQATDRENHNRPTGVTPRLISTLGN